MLSSLSGAAADNMMREKLTSFDPAEGLTSDEAIAAYTAEALASGDADYIAHALDIVARAKKTLGSN